MKLSKGQLHLLQFRLFSLFSVVLHPLIFFPPRIFIPLSLDTRELACTPQKLGTLPVTIRIQKKLVILKIVLSKVAVFLREESHNPNLFFFMVSLTLVIFAEIFHFSRSNPRPRLTLTGTNDCAYEGAAPVLRRI